MKHIFSSKQCGNTMLIDSDKHTVLKQCPWCNNLHNFYYDINKTSELQICKER